MESVTFFSPFTQLQFYIPEKKIVQGEFSKVEPAKIIEFESGQYKTSNEAEIEAIRTSNAFSEGKIFEVTDKDKMAVLQRPDKPVAHRGVLTAQHITKEAGKEVREEPGKISLQEGITKCDEPGCDATFQQDFYKRKVKMHKLKHRREKRAK